jgi:hypothetical protein
MRSDTGGIDWLLRFCGKRKCGVRQFEFGRFVIIIFFIELDVFKFVLFELFPVEFVVGFIIAGLLFLKKLFNELFILPGLLFFFKLEQLKQLKLVGPVLYCHI